MKNSIIQIEKLKNEKGLLTISRGANGKLQLEDRPTGKSCGLYWIYTSYSLEELCSSIKSSQENAVNIPILANNRRELSSVIKPVYSDAFWIVYNGIGGSSEGSTHSYDLGERILQEFRDNKKTGSLKILGTTLNDLSKWRYTYVELDLTKYHKYKREYETCWRLEYGWPILSRQ